MLSRQRWLCVAMAAGMVLAAEMVLAAAPATRAIQPADPDLIPEGRRLLDYLISQRGGRIVSGCMRSGPGSGPFEAWILASGREPALRGFNIAGFHPPGSDVYHGVLKGTVQQTLYWGRDKGGIVAMLYHWTWPTPDGKVSFMKNAHKPPLDLKKMTTPGTDEYKEFHRQLSLTADYLEQIAEARVPLLFRPFHEIDGGWFWWTDAETPENTAALWRQMFDYLVKERKIHNLIWDFAAAHVAHASRGRIRKAHDRNPTIEEEAQYRSRFYPGDKYVDLVGSSVYGARQFYDWGWGAPKEENYAKAYELLRAIAPNKPLAVAESPNLLNPEIAKKDGPDWLYDMSWYGGDPQWMRFTLNHSHFIKLDELPLLREGNVMPNVRIDRPTDGPALDKDEVEIAGFASDRNGNLASVAVYAIAGSWLNWLGRGDDQVKKELEARGERLGEARIGAGGRWTFTWKGAPPGYSQLIAVATDDKGATACSNAVRVTVAVNDLALGKPAAASSRDKWDGPAEDAVDGDPWTAWSADRKAPDPQWLQVDLGAVRTVGAASVLWGKPYAKNYTVQVSENGQDWREVASVKNRNVLLGDSDVFRFEPAKARYVRLHCAKPAVTWQTYAVHHFGVYERLPERK